MELAFNSTQPVGEIVAAFPGASNLFKAHNVDFCCGGARPLGEVLREHGIPEHAFLAELQQAFTEARRRQEAAETDWRVAPLSELVDRIVTVHHRYLKQELPVLSEFVSKIFFVHGSRHPELQTLGRQFHQLKAELEPHLFAEETELFPLIQAYENSGAQSDAEQAVKVLDQLETQHQTAGQLLHDMRETTKGYLLPEDACRTYTLTFQKLADLESDTFEHIHLENNVLFPRLRQAAGGAKQ